jgi:hypothetical protein
MYLAAGHAAVGDQGGAIEWLQRYDSPRNLHFLLHLRCDALLDPLTGNPEFQALRDQVKLPGCRSASS